MWKRDTGRATEIEGDLEATPPVEPERPTRIRETTPVEASTPEHPGGPVMIGRSVFVKGELTASEDFQIDGTVEGTVDLSDHVLTIGRSGVVRAEISAKSVIILGTVKGNVLALDRIDLREEGSVEGDIIAPRVAMAEGSRFQGSIDMHAARASGAKAVAMPPRKAKAGRTAAKAAAG